MTVRLCLFFVLPLLLPLAAVPVPGQVGGAPLRPGDEVLLRVWPDTTLSGRYRVEPDGRAYLPLIGPVDVFGQEIEALRSALVDKYSQIMRSPVVVVVPRFRVSILGGVRAPGLYFVEHPTTLMDVVGMAGGFDQSAKASEVRLLRGQSVFGVDAERALGIGAPTADVPLESGDRIVVPTSNPFPVLQVLQIVVSLTTFVTLVSR